MGSTKASYTRQAGDWGLKLRREQRQTLKKDKSSTTAWPPQFAKVQTWYGLDVLVNRYEVPKSKK